MTEQQTARERIADVIDDTYREGQSDGYDEHLGLRDYADKYEVADSIIAIVAEALLGDAAVEALLIHGPHIPSDLGKQMYGKDARQILDQVIAAAFGPTDPAQEVW